MNCRNMHAAGLIHGRLGGGGHKVDVVRHALYFGPDAETHHIPFSSILRFHRNRWCGMELRLFQACTSCTSCQHPARSGGVLDVDIDKVKPPTSSYINRLTCSPFTHRVASTSLTSRILSSHISSTMADYPQFSDHHYYHFKDTRDGLFLTRLDAGDDVHKVILAPFRNDDRQKV